MNCGTAITQSILVTVFTGCFFHAAAQDVILKRDSVKCKILRETADQYIYTYRNENNAEVKDSILKSLVDTVKYADGTVSVPAIAGAESWQGGGDSAARVRPLKFSVAIGLNVSHILEFNPPGDTDKNYLAGTGTIDLALNYYKDGSRFQMTNELHWLFSIQKSGFKRTDHIQSLTDELRTLHDYSIGIDHGNKWNLNMIAKATTSVCAMYNGDQFEDFNHTGKTRAFLNPYDVTLSPGIKYEPVKGLRLSVSPYSMNLYGLESQKIANTGLYTHDSDAHHNYTRFVFTPLGAEVNIWFDCTIREWLEIEYRIGISSDYFDKIGKTGLMDGLFITKIKLMKDLYLSHRASLRGDLAQPNFKPYYTQTILLSFTREF